MSTQGEQADRLVCWRTPVLSTKALTNFDLQTRSMESLIASFEDLDRKERHAFWFSKVLGYRFENGFNMGRVWNTFVLKDSTWIAQMSRKPFRTVNLASAKHYEFSFVGGNFQLVALNEPLYRICSSTEYCPTALSEYDFGDLPCEGPGEERLTPN